MKRILAFILVVTLAFSVFPMAGLAAEVERIYLEDGSYFLITIVEWDSRASGTKTASKTYTYNSSSGVALWKAVLKGTFVYTGTSSTCTASSCDVTILDSDWYVVSNTAGKSGNSATAELTMGHKLLGITVNKKTANLALTCDENGNLS